MPTPNLIALATSLINPKEHGEISMGTVACALLSAKGNVFTGVCIDTPCGTGFCAEAAAIGAMVTAGEYRIKKIVAVWKDERGKTYVVSPCGRCREFMAQIDEKNLGAEVVLGKNKAEKLNKLSPHYHKYNLAG